MSLGGSSTGDVLSGLKLRIRSYMQWKRFPNGMNKSLLIEKLSAAVFSLCGRDTRVQFRRR